MGGERMNKVITLDGKIINLGEWDYLVSYEDRVGNPFPGPLEAPPDWDFRVAQVPVVGNPMPEGAIEEEIDVFFGRDGVLRRVDTAHEYELESRVAAASYELSELLVDIRLGLATPEELERAKQLRTFIKENPLP